MARRVSIELSGMEGALADAGALAGLQQAAGDEAAGETARATRGYAIQLTTRRYNLSEDDLEPYVVGSYGTGGRSDGWSSVRLLARPIPISTFRPEVRMRSFRLMSRGRRPRAYTRTLPTVWVKRFRNGSAKQLGGYFPLHQRSSGTLAGGESVRRRVGGNASGRGVSRDGQYEGNKLTGVRYYTFPKRFLAEIQPQLVEFVGSRGQVELRAAYRKWFRGQRVLRGPR